MTFPSWPGRPFQVFCYRRRILWFRISLVSVLAAVACVPVDSLAVHRLARKNKKTSQSVSPDRGSKLRSHERGEIPHLLKIAINHLRLHQFKKAEKTIEEILEIDPTNEPAFKLREFAEEEQILQFEGTQTFPLENEEISEEAMRRALTPWVSGPVIFPDTGFWQRAKNQKLMAAETEDSSWISDYKKILSTRKIDINFSDAYFSDVISFMQDVTGLNITVSRDIDTLALKVNLSHKDIVLQNAFRLLLDQTKLAMTFEQEAIKIIPRQ